MFIISTKNLNSQSLDMTQGNAHDCLMAVRRLPCPGPEVMEINNVKSSSFEGIGGELWMPCSRSGNRKRFRPRVAEGKTPSNSCHSLPKCADPTLSEKVSNSNTTSILTLLQTTAQKPKASHLKVSCTRPFLPFSYLRTIPAPLDPQSEQII